MLQIRSVEFAGKYKVKLRVLSSFDDPESPASGTLITFEEDENMEQAIISGIAFNRDEAKISVMGVPDKPGIAYAILGPDRRRQHRRRHDRAEHRRIEAITDFSFTVHRNEYRRRSTVLERGARQAASRRARSSATTGSARSRVVGIGMRSHVGIASKMFKALADEGINIQMISTSEIKISVVIDEKYMELAVRVLHKAFELDKEPGVMAKARRHHRGGVRRAGVRAGVPVGRLGRRGDLQPQPRQGRAGRRTPRASRTCYTDPRRVDRA